MRVYVAGPMFSAGGNFNFPLFDYVSQKLRNTGCEVFNPAELARETLGGLKNIQSMSKQELAKSARAHLKIEMAWICDHAEVIYLLPGWEYSPGATAERALGIALDIIVDEADPSVSLMRDDVTLKIDVPAVV